MFTETVALSAVPASPRGKRQLLDESPQMIETLSGEFMALTLCVVT